MDGDSSLLTHVLTGVQITPYSHGDDPGNDNFIWITSQGGLIIKMIASMYLELMLAEDAAHQLHSASHGSGQIHQLSKEMLERLADFHGLPKQAKAIIAVETDAR